MDVIVTAQNMIYKQRRIQFFFIKGAQKIMTHIKTTKYEVPYNWGSGPWKLWGLDAPSRYLSLIIYKNIIVDQNLEGGARLLRPPPPPGSATGKLSFSITFVNIPIGEIYLCYGSHWGIKVEPSCARVSWATTSSFVLYSQIIKKLSTNPI